MSMQKGTLYRGGATRWRVLAGCLLASLCLILPTTAWADPGSEGPETCAQCHPEQAAIWQDSPHAQAMTLIESSLETACGDGVSPGDCECLSCHTTFFDPSNGSYADAGVTCEACHGPYVSNHPQDGAMPLHVDATQCQECHSTTYQEWHETAHAKADVECTGCHLPHSQDTRLTGEELCGSCHRDELEDWTHHDAGVTCTDCHVSSPSVADLSEVRVTGGSKAPDHGFELVVGSCASCHGQSIHQNVFNASADPVDMARLTKMTARAQDLANELEDAKRENRSLRTVSVVSLGFGLGVGGVLGVVFLLVVGYISQGRAER